MGRLCYGPEEVKQFRENVRRDIVPWSLNCAQKSGSGWGVDTLRLYDYDLIFLRGTLFPGREGRPSSLRPRRCTMT